MKHTILSEVQRYQRMSRRRRLWQRGVAFLAAVVTFCTTYALILPAITLENGWICGQAEHQHDDSCFQLVEAEQSSTVLVCAPEVHIHAETCYDGEGHLSCGLADRLLHSHDENCYDSGGQLMCSLPEVAEHIHNAGCYQETQVLRCGQEETWHEHGEGCYTAQRGEMNCTAEEEEHQHTDECFHWEQVLTCEVPENPAGHRHSEECYERTRTLICPMEQVAAHQHGPDCYDEAGALSCGILSAQVHQHTEACRQTNTVYTKETKLICQLAQHSHTDACRPADEEEPEPTPEEPGAQEGAEMPAAPGIPEAAEDPEKQGAPEGAQEPENQEVTKVPSVVLPIEPLPGWGLELPFQEILTPQPDEVLEPSCLCGWTEHTHSDRCYDGSGALSCGMDAHFHTEMCLTTALPTPAEQSANESSFSAEIDTLTAEGAETMLARLTEAHGLGWISDRAYAALCARVQALLDAASGPDVDLDGVAEAAEGTNWMYLRDSGWFEEYSAAAIGNYSLSAYSGYALRAAQAGDTSPSGVQIDNSGGTNAADDVTVSKTIAGTELENVFDITLTVKTPQKLDEVITEPDMAVVIVMDISNTMNDNFGGVTRYAAAMEAAEDFLDNFADNNTLGVSKVGYVAFNTDAHQIFGLQSCTNETQANALKNAMRTSTGSIINANGYGVAHNRFTNIEGGLKMAQDMLNGVSNKNKFIILLTDGFPTTYLESGYKGYDPYDTSGRFYDHVLNVPCASGTSYSDEAAIRARNMAASIRNSGTTIFSIGVDVGGQTIQAYIESSEKLAAGTAKISVVDRTGTTYEIGSATSTEAYKNWLKNSIGSGYYYDSTNTAGLKDAYNQIFAQIKTTIETAAEADWVATDPIPSISPEGEVEFIGLYEQGGSFCSIMSGTAVVSGENTAVFATDGKTISWDLKKSGYTTETSGSTTTYTYQLKYRVRLTNEDGSFVENTIYNTNGTTTLQYRVVKTENGTTTISDTKTIDFPIPSVHGYLGELTFQKQDGRGSPLAGAEFTLSHDSQCNICRGNKTRVEISEMTATSDADGKVSFTGIPSGHTYTLTETVIPPGYSTDGSKYTVTVAYDQVTVTVTDSGNNPKDWNGTIVNHTYYELPNTGGSGTQWYYIAGAALIAAAGLLYRFDKRRRGEFSFH